jgi:thymidylate kinase
MSTKNKLVVITGVDGSGKSSVIEALQAEYLGKAKLFTVLRVSAANSSAKEKIDNHALPQRSVAASLLKLFLRSAAWLWRYKTKYEPLLRQGYMVVLDRFYMDELMLDPRKHRYAAPIWLTQWVRNVLPHPDIYILLDADERVLYSRKQETSLLSVRQLRLEYLRWTQKQPQHYILDASLPIENVVGDVNQIIKGWIQT